MSGDTGLGRLAHQRMFNVRSLRKGLSSPALVTVADDYVLGSPSTVNTSNPNWPLIGTSISLNAGPFDVFPFTSTSIFAPGLDVPNQSALKPIFFDISDRIQDFSTSVGKQYELDTISAGEATTTILDRDEAFNPTNPNSPYYPNVKIYRQIADIAMWPPVPSGGNVNLLNVNSFPYVDPTFESYAFTGTTTTLGPFIQDSFGSCNISTTNPFSGTKCLALATAAVPNQQSYVTFAVPCIPGQKYTTSVYVRTDTAFYVYMGLFDGTATGTNMNVATTYVRLQVSYTATKPVHLVMVATDGITNTGGAAIRFDNIQHECGGVANAFSTSGPVIYGLFSGFVERWPASWNFHGTYGMAQITATDGFANLANETLDTEVHNAITFLNPDYYWPLNESQGATSFGDQSGHGHASLVLTAAKDGAGSFTADAGTSSTIVGDRSGVGVQFTQTGIPSTGYYLTAPVAVGNNTTSWGVTIVGCMSTTFTSIDLFIELLGSGVQNDGITIFPQFQMLGAGANTGFDLATATAGSLSADFVVTGGDTYSVNDGVGRMFGATLSIQGNTGTLKAYLDNKGSINTYGGTFDVLATFGTSTPDFTFNKIVVMADETKATNRVTQGGIVSHVAVWNSVIDVVSLMRVASSAYSGDRTDQRIGRYLRMRQFSYTNLEQGATTLNPSSLSAGTAALDAIQAVTISENGNFFFDGFGVATFQSRTHRYLETSATWVFGENAASGEAPYADDINFDFDPTLVVNAVDVEQVDGVRISSFDLASQSDYGILSSQISTSTNNTGEVADYANWIVYTHAQPFQRVSSVSINPAANPALWPVALGAKLGDRVTLKRRTTANYVMQQDYFIERIERSRDSTMSFVVTFQLSPTGAGGQPWIIEDPIFGVLDSTTICGF